MHRSTPRYRAPTNGLAPASLHRVLEYLHRHYDHEIALADLAALAHLSPCYFLRQFRRSTGFTPHQYHLRLRLARAVTLLREGKLTGTTIAQAVGFSDQSHLAYHFRRVYGTTPGMWQGHSPGN